MNTITPVQPVHFTSTKRVPTDKVIKYIQPNPNVNIKLAEQTPKMKELTTALVNFFNEQALNLQKAIADLNKKFPYFNIQSWSKPYMHGDKFIINSMQEDLYTKNAKKEIHRLKEINGYNITTRDKTGVINFKFLVTDPQCSEALYGVPEFFAQKTPITGEYKAHTERKIEQSLKDLLKYLENNKN